MVTRNPEIAKYQSNYLFVEINKRKNAFLESNPNAPIINLGIGDTTEPIAPNVVNSFIKKAKELGSESDYTGYGDALGNVQLRTKISDTIYHGRISCEDIFISDGAKCDFGRLQLLFGRDCTMMVQDPSYPVYVATSVMAGKSGIYDPKIGQYNNITYIQCKPDNDFFPDIENLPKTDLIIICSPNNPTGKALTYQQLKHLIKVAKDRGSIIIYDSAYAGFIRENLLPRSIYEVEGAEEVAIEIGSLSKIAGFTGIRLGWTIVPKKLTFCDGSRVQDDWKKIVSTFFNGASNLAQAGALAALSKEGLEESTKLCDYYLQNAKTLKQVIEDKGYTCFGGTNCPYLWMSLGNQCSWDFFDELLHKAHLITTPGIGFGPSGEGFIRLSAFGKRSIILEAKDRLIRHLTRN